MAADGKHPKFQRPNYGVKKRVGKAWRRPRGIDNKLRIKKRWAGTLPAIGYRSAKKTRGIHPCGKSEVLVSNAKQLGSLNGKDVAVRFSATLGAKKKRELTIQAKEFKLKILLQY